MNNFHCLFCFLLGRSDVNLVSSNSFSAHQRTIVAQCSAMFRTGLLLSKAKCRLFTPKCIRVVGVQANVRCFSSTPLRSATTDSASVVAAVEAQAAQQVAGVDQLATQNVELTFADLGLGTDWWLTDLIQNYLETLYLATGLSWWATIAVGTLSLRLLTLPIYIGTRKFMIRQSNCMPKQRKLMAKAKEQSGLGTAEEFEARMRWLSFLKENRIGPVRALLTNLPMPLLFISTMMALREMIAVPVPSLEASKLLWIDSLCSYDPYYILPATAGAVFGVTMYTSFKAGMLSTPNETAVKLMKYLPFVPPVVMPLFMGHLSSAILIYIMTNGCFTFGMTGLLRIEKVKNIFNMPVLDQRAAEERASMSMKQSFQNFEKEQKRKKEIKEIKKYKKLRAREMKNSLEEVPKTYVIDQEAFAKKHTPDFEKDWRPVRPRMPGLL